MTSQRITERQRIFIAGKLVYGGGAMRSDCTVRDLSPHGARVTTSSSVTLPSRVTLEIPSKNVVEEAIVRWRHGDVFGLEFPSAERAVVPESAEERVRALEAENAQLRKQIKDLRAELAMRIHRDDSSN